jgi:hypothetical protein
MEISNDIQIARDLKHNQSISLRICLYFFSFIRFSMNLYEVGCQDCQNKYSCQGIPTYILLVTHKTSINYVHG